ncbi:MAG: hypothetical protein ACHQDE_05780, partial [Acidimicrobiia bacterium]
VSASGFTGATFDVGPYQREGFVLLEANAQGRQLRGEIFAVDRLGDAIARLYERYAELLSDGPERERAAATARSVAALQRSPFDLDQWATALAPDIESVDHRILGTWSAHGAEAVRLHMRSLLDLVDGFAKRDDNILALRPDAFLVHRSTFGTLRAGGGPFGRDHLGLWVFGVDGLVTRWEMFDIGHDAEALARFDELLNRSVSPLGTERIEEAAARSAQRFENAATRSLSRFQDAWAARDWDGIASTFAPGLRLSDRRSYAHLDLDRDQHLASLRFRFEMRSSRVTHEVLATRGQRLALYWIRFELADGDVGPSETESLGITETDEHGDVVALVVFDPNDLDAAYAELDRRYDAGEGAALGGVTTRYVQSFAKRDLEGIAALCAPTFVEHDHRRITGLGTTRGADVWVENNVRVWIDLAPDIVTRFTHIRAHGRGVLWQISLQGSREGGRFEIAFVGVTVLDEQCRVERVDIYDLDQLDEAFVRFDELTGEAPESPLATSRVPLLTKEGSGRLSSRASATSP